MMPRAAMTLEVLRWEEVERCWATMVFSLSACVLLCCPTRKPLFSLNLPEPGVLPLGTLLSFSTVILRDSLLGAAVARFFILNVVSCFLTGMCCLALLRKRFAFLIALTFCCLGLAADMPLDWLTVAVLFVCACVLFWAFFVADVSAFDFVVVFAFTACRFSLLFCLIRSDKVALMRVDVMESSDMIAQKKKEE